MFDISWAKLLVIGVVALIFIGPKELPEIMHTLGKTLGKLRRSADDFRRQFEDSMHEAGYKDLHKNLQDFRSLNPTNHLKSTIEKALLAEPPASPTTHQTISQTADQSAVHAKDDPTVTAPAQVIETAPVVHLNGAQPANPIELPRPLA